MRIKNDQLILDASLVNDIPTGVKVAGTTGFELGLKPSELGVVDPTIVTETVCVVGVQADELEEAVRTRGERVVAGAAALDKTMTSGLTGCVVVLGNEMASR